MIVLSAQTSASKKCEQLKMNGAFSGLRGYIYNELLVKDFGPKFHKSYEVSHKLIGVIPTLYYRITQSTCMYICRERNFLSQKTIKFKSINT